MNVDDYIQDKELRVTERNLCGCCFLETNYIQRILLL